MREFAARHGILLWDVGEGIGHQLIVETARALPGGLAVGADSHAVTYGALNTFATGIGSSDLAAILISGEMWLRVPESIRVTLTGELPCGVYPKDVALALAKELGADGANYQALEFAGDGLASLELEDRLVIANLSIEMGAKNGIFPADEKTFAYLSGARGEPAAADRDARYSREFDIALDRLTPHGRTAASTGSRRRGRRNRARSGAYGLSRHMHWRTGARLSSGARRAKGRRAASRRAYSL